MKNLSKWYILPALFLGVVSCSEDRTEEMYADGQKTTFSAAMARQCFENSLRTTRSGNDESYPLALTSLQPDWAEATLSEGQYLHSVDVPLPDECPMRLIRYDSCGQPVATPMYHKIVVVKDKGDQLEGAYVMFYLPDSGYAENHDRDTYDFFRNSLQKGRFNGMTVYTTIDGCPISAGRYENGKMTQWAFLCDTTDTFDHNAEKLSQMLDGLYVQHRSGNNQSGIR